MPVETLRIDTLVIGAGQAGIAMSEHLSRQGVPHLVVERSRIAEAWRTSRWDSLVANGPAWHDRFPGLEFDGLDPDAFATKDQVADYFEAYASKFNAPIRTGVDVRKVERNVGRPGFTVETSEGLIEAIHVVVATGPFQRPVIPPIAPDMATVTQLHSAQYRNPGQLPGVAVLGRVQLGNRRHIGCNRWNHRPLEGPGGDNHMNRLDQAFRGFNGETRTADIALDLPDVHAGADRRVELAGIGFEIIGHLVLCGEGIRVEPVEFQPRKTVMPGRAIGDQRIPT